jgi:uncharacterized protein DUF87
MASRSVPAIPDAALEHHVALLGKTGSGKSFASQGVAERLISRKRRVCIIDPTDRYWGLRLLADGKNPSGFEPVIFGGQHGDLPLSATHGAALAEIVGTTTTPVIIATRLLTVGERARFFTEFAETLLRKNEGSLHLIVDEAHLFAPQTKVQSVESGRLLHATNNLVSLGRGIGLRIMMLSQRPAKLHKDALTQIETLVAFRLIAPQDRNAIRDWVREWADEATGAELMSSLPSLPTGTAWMWAPELDILRKVGFPLIATYDSGKPRAGAKDPALKPIDLAAVRGKLELVAKEAVENDPRRLKARIAALEREVLLFSTSNEGAKINTAAIEAAEQRGYQRGRQDGQREGAIAAARELRSRTGVTSVLLALGMSELTFEESSRREILPKPALATPAETGGKYADPISATAGRPRRDLPNPTQVKDGLLPRGERACLIAAAQHVEGVSRGQMTVLTGYKRRTRDAYIQRLRERGFVDIGARISATAAGVAALGTGYEPLPTGTALRDYWLGRLPEGERRILESLIGAFPEALLRAAIDEATDYKRRTRDAYLQRLRARELIEISDDGVRATDKLFELSETALEAAEESIERADAELSGQRPRR